MSTKNKNILTAVILIAISATIYVFVAMKALAQ